MNIQVNAHTLTITIENDINAGEYNITPCTFEFSEEYDGLTKEAIFSTCETTVKTSILNNQCVIPFEVLENPGNVLVGVFGYETDNDDLVLRYSPKPQYFNVKDGSFREGNDPDLPKPSEWEQVLEQINQAITETNNLNITVEKTDGITTITLTKKDGTTQTVQIEDGKSLEFKWSGTSLGVRQEGQSEYQYVDLKGAKGDPGAISFEIVAELPTENIKEDTIYLVPITPDTSGNNYAEYIYINGQWELLGKIGVQIDLTNYVQFTDYANNDTGGVIKTSNGLGINNSTGKVQATTRTYAEYEAQGNSYFISKGTLENVLANKPIKQITGTSQSPIILTSLTTGLYQINGYYTDGTNTYGGEGLIEFLQVLAYNNGVDSIYITGLGGYFNFEKGLNNTWNLIDKGFYLNNNMIATTYQSVSGVVYDATYINSLVGDINSVLDAINGETI